MPKRVVIFILLLVVIFYASFKPVNASISSCPINSYSPQSLTSGESATIVFNITNNDESSNLLHWLKVTAPSNFVITSLDGPSSGGTTINESGSEAVIMTTLSSGESGDFSVGVNTTGGVTSSGSFNIQASDSSSGDSPANCSGDTNVSLTSGGSSAITISNISLSVSDKSATITWSSSIPTTGSVQYGTSSGYGSSVGDTSLGTSHSVTLSSLSPSTQYHYLVTSTDQSNNTASLTDKTFTTSPSGETKVVTSTVTSTITNTVREVYKDVILPSIRIKTDFKKIYKIFPTIDFVASDGSGISRLRYSTDDGRNWLPISIDDKIGKKQIVSSFDSNVTDDGEYILIIEATDSAGNKNLTKPIKFTIDRLSPIIGPLIVMAGPQIVGKENDGILNLIANTEYKFILSSSGGPNTITMSCGDNVYNFQKNIDSGVWTAKIKFDTSVNECSPEIIAIDGAGNQQEKVGQKIIVNKKGKFKNGLITVYWYDDYENRFVKWDASSYGQENPIATNSVDGYSLLLPKGKYYLEAKSLGKRTTVSNIINLDSVAIVNDDWLLSPVWKFWQFTEEKKINPKKLGSGEWEDSVFELPNIKLINTDKSSLSTYDLRGHVSVVGITTTWHPLTNEYLKTLEDLKNSGVSVYPIMLQEKFSTVNFLKRRGGYKLDIYSDQDGDMLKGLDIRELPVTLIVDKYGKILKQKVGLIPSKSEVLQEIVNIY